MKKELEAIIKENREKTACRTCDKQGICKNLDWTKNHDLIVVTNCSGHPNQKKYPGHSTTVVVTASLDKAFLSDYTSYGTWADARNAAVAASVAASLKVMAGFDGAYYGAAKVGALFDTSAIPAGYTITAVKHDSYITSVGTVDGGDDQKVYIKKKSDWTAPHDPMVVADYERTQYGDDHGNGVAVASAWLEITCSNPATMINKGGVTAIALMHNMDYDNDAPAAGGDNEITIDNYLSGNAQHLHITFETNITDSIVKTAQWRVSGSPGASTLNRFERAQWKRAVRIKNQDTGILDGAVISYGAPGSEAFTFGIHFRLEDCFGGHANERYIASCYSGGVGWRLSYLVATEEVQLIVDDGIAATVTLTAPINDVDWKWWVFTYQQGNPDGIKLYYGTSLMDTGSSAGLASIAAGVNVSIGDGTNGIAMMFGGLFLATPVITPPELQSINTSKDSDWTITTLTFAARVPGEFIDWGGGLDVDEANSRWLDVSGNARNLDYTLADDANSMAREIARTTHTISGTLRSLELSRHGSVAIFDASDDETAAVGDVITIRDAYNGWCGRVEKITKDAGGKIIRATGIDEQTSRPPFNMVFGTRSTNQNDKVEDATNLMVNNTEGADAGSGYGRINEKEALTKDALNAGLGVAPGLMAINFWDEAATEFGLTDFSIKSREKTMKESASDVIVFGYYNGNIPYLQSGMASGATVYNLDRKPNEVISVVVGGSAVYSGYHIDSDNQQLIFDVATGGNVDITYTCVDYGYGTAHSDEIEASLGKKVILEVHVGYVGDAQLADIAERLLRDSYWILAIKPRSKKWYKECWYPNKKIYINQTDNPFEINGYYFVTKVTWEGTIAATPMLQLEQYDDATGIPPTGTHGSANDLQDEWADGLDRNQHNERGFTYE